ncbi:terpene synthase [Microbispora sp. NEAU-D428]|uniref:terpene synthase family protein n=1 Tax=Microbispora sitophila TaxID=2771537 RepID=UPI001867FDD7|nr:terpene synthase family protein [Microbispora sitophila]MBE3013554.1 terpene synthase [Microbispora sitophila]
MTLARSREAAHLAAAAASGRTSALAARCQRDLQECAGAFPELFAANPFDATLFGTVSLANAFGSPWATAEQLRIANRTSLWIFAVDWLIDHEATSQEEIDEILRGCLAVAYGREPVPHTPLTRFLAAIRDDLAASPLFPSLHAAWRAELERMLGAMAREWKWKQGGETALPTFEEYLGNADNFGSTLVNVGHWIHSGDPLLIPHLDELLRASGIVQRVLRLLNDLATYERDVGWGDLNALMLGVSRDEVLARVAALTGECRAVLGPLRSVRPDESAYLERQIGYSTGFYGLADYWGEL